MAKFRGIVEDSQYATHAFIVDAETKEEAENLAIFKISEELGDNLESFEILVCSEILTEEQAAAYVPVEPNLLPDE